MEYQILLTYFAKFTFLVCQVHIAILPSSLFPFVANFNVPIAKSTMLVLILQVYQLHFAKPGKVEIAQFSSQSCKGPQHSQIANSTLLFCQIAKSTSHPMDFSNEFICSQNLKNSWRSNA